MQWTMQSYVVLLCDEFEEEKYCDEWGEEFDLEGHEKS